MAFQAHASEPAPGDTLLIPERVVSVGGDPGKAADLVAILYNRQELHFSDPSAPRFLFVDRDGKVALGIGGYVKGTLQYDFRGAIDDGASFVTYDIPVPANPAQREQYYANANHSTIFLQMLGRTERFGTYEMFIQTNFSGGGNDGYGLKLKQAYLRLGYVTAGLTTSTFVDGAAGTPTIDDQGPAGEATGKNIMLQYKPMIAPHVKAAISLEMPHAGYRPGTEAEAIYQRFPDIPAFIQYGWQGGASHVRLSGLLRRLSYRDMLAGSNRYATGWALQLSGTAAILSPLRVYFQGAIGNGYGHYVNDLSEASADLIPDPDKPGHLRAPRMTNLELGLRYDLTPKAFLTAAYSQASLHQARFLGPDTYKRGQYVTVSGFYDIIGDLSIGLEYIYGRRTDYDGSHGSANRIEGMLKLAF
ncbi:MAG: porin [Alloprevotella sp.]|nr:porin [Alloprevotella sp.]